MTNPTDPSMALDFEMAEIAKIFFAESREGLDVMESGLLGLGAAEDGENINRIFRAAHSIKGGSATFAQVGRFRGRLGRRAVVPAIGQILEDVDFHLAGGASPSHHQLMLCGQPDVLDLSRDKTTYTTQRDLPESHDLGKSLPWL